MGLMKTGSRLMLLAAMALCLLIQPGSAGATNYIFNEPGQAKKSNVNEDHHHADAPKKLNIYFWRGHEVKAGFLKNQNFLRIIKSICREHNFKFDLEPDKNRLLQMLAWADVAYGTVHAGYSSSLKKAIIQTGPSGSEQYGLGADEIAAWRKRVGDEAVPSVIILGGCNSMTSQYARKPIFTIPQALGFSQGSPRNKVMIGWAEYIIGAKAERIARLTLVHWLHKNKENNTYRGIKQAIDAGMAFAKHWHETYAPNADSDAEQLKKLDRMFINKNDKLMVDAAVILGNPELTLPQAEK